MTCRTSFQIQWLRTFSQKKLEAIRKRHLHSIIYDKVTNCSNIEQLNIRKANDNLDRHEDFLVFYEVHNIKNGTIVAAINKKILRFNFLFEFYYSQIYNGASSMVGKKKMLLLRYQQFNRGLFSLIFYDSLSLAGTVVEITVPVTFFSKVEKKLVSLIENVEGVAEYETG